ncbi:MAG: hypothetical protein JSU70_19505 [Phycisphaerales bacterium]|nr:MAG: hypothetical protein JSU70_19505 [Phycisphaerales bacterium]
MCSYSWRVPLRAAGKLKIVASQDIGDLGPAHSEPVFYYWTWFHSIPSLALWVVLALAIVLVKANRRAQALLILVPMLIANLLWFGFRKANGLGDLDEEVFTMLLLCFVTGISVLWLLGHLIGNRNRLVTFLLAWAIMATVGLVGVVSSDVTETLDDTGFAVLILVMAALAVLAGVALAGWCCRKRFGGPRFTLWLGPWTVVASVVFAVLLGVTVAFVKGVLTSYIVEILLVVMWIGLISGACAYAFVLPYVILALCSSFFRDRLHACLQLKSMAPEGADADGPISTPERPKNSDSA